MKIKYYLYFFIITNACAEPRSNLEIFKDKIILITGGAGFIGKALITKILNYNPKKIIVFSRDEFKHFQILDKFQSNKITTIIGDVRDADALDKALDGVDIVLHAAALKRIDILESSFDESIKTNILGTLNLVKSCKKNGIKQAVLVSTDKACFPINVYGACKFLSEKIFTNSQDSNTIFSVVRYGNVLESTGSIIPFLANRIQEDAIIPLTDYQMTRFIITKEDAVDLIFNALRFSQGGEIFVPQLPSLRIIDLITTMKNIFKKENKIAVIGLRPGEKIHEILVNKSEMLRAYEYNNMYIITSCLRNTNLADKLPIYISEGIAAKNMTNISSKDFVVSIEKIESILKNMDSQYLKYNPEAKRSFRYVDL
ncbi:hypothetical protein A3F66_05225 [candidate division TM6 bacterium RIFCSPHIGHO2_12_FULL_32_22]|nr:MAG: hypothetical protein A3F66_05225 [candidate division TM6 bacterium RIFCSPHIGHO2_12_FULL_32_22]